MHVNARSGQPPCHSKEAGVQQNIFINEAGESLSFMRKAEYIGSFLVTGSAHFERADIVRQKLEAARGYTQSKSILLVISLHGIKVCDDSGTNVHMAHALRRISYATCDPDCCQFAFLAREPKAQPNVQYCHAFVTKTAEEAENLNNLVGEAFRIAYAQQRALLESRRAVAQTQTSNLPTEPAAAIAANSPHHHRPHSHPQPPPPPPPPPPVASNPVPEADSGIATAEATSFRQKVHMIGYLAADSGLSSSESAPRASKPRSSYGASDNDDVDDADNNEGSVESPQGKPKLPLRAGLTSTNQSHCCHAPQNSGTPTPEKRGLSHSPSASSANAYDQASESQHGQPCIGLRRRQAVTTDAASASGSCSSDGGAGSLKTSAGGVAAAHHVGPPISAPWYQPHIPRELALDILSRQSPGSFIVRDSGTHSNCYALSVRVTGGEAGHPHIAAAADRCISAGIQPRTSLGSTSASSGGGGGLINHYLIQRTATGVRLKGLEKEWPSLSCLILHLTVMPEMLPCPLLDAPQSASNPTAFLHGGAAAHPPHFEQAPDAFAFRPISIGGGEPSPLTSPPPPPPHSEYQQLSEFSSLLADLNLPDDRHKHRRHPPPPPPARIR